MSDRGHVVWYDLMTPDPEGAAAFYRQLVGYGQQSWDEGDYDMFTVPGGERTMGGVMKLPDEAITNGARPHWVGYVSVDELDDTCAKVKELGGAVLREPTTIPNAGSFAVCADPQGAVFAMYSHSGGSGPVHDKPQVGEMAWAELETTDHEAALDFYSTVFGWKRTEAADMGEGWMYQMFGTDRTLGGAFTKKPDMPGPASWLYYIHVDDVKASVDKAKELGATLLNGPMEVPGGDLIAQLQDPQGATFALHGSRQG